MAWNPKELFTDGTAKAVGVLIVPGEAGTRVCKIAGASGAPTLLVGTPMAYDESVDKWKVWTGLTDFESASIAVDATGGTWRITIEGQTTADIAFNATAAAVKLAIELLPGIGPGDIKSVTGGPGVAGGGTPYVITWGGRYQGKDAPAITTVVTGTPPLLTGGAATAAVTTTAGVEKSGTDVIRGFVYPSDIPLHATNDTAGVIMLKGEIHYEAIVLPAGEVEASLKAALQSGCRERGLNIENLANVR